MLQRHSRKGEEKENEIGLFPLKQLTYSLKRGEWSRACPQGNCFSNLRGDRSEAQTLDKRGSRPFLPPSG
jgi:hypothetical protein